MNAFEVVGSYVLKGAEKAGSQIQGLSERASKSSKIIDNTSQRIDMLGKSVSSVGGKMSKWVTGPLAAAGAGMVALANKGANAAKEIENYAKLTGESVEDFQAQAFAADTVGIELDKYGDILKDVQDRVGDFMATGAGPMADFFEKIAPRVGVTAESFRGLGGKDALQLYVSSLERANVSQQEMTFYMEAIAGDASKLIPLFAENGKQLKTLGDRARDTGLIMSAELIESSKEGRQSLRIMGAAFDALANKIGLKLVPAFEAIVPVLTGVVIPAIEKFSDIVVGISEVFASLPEPLQQLISTFAIVAAAMGPILFVFGKLISAIATLRPFLAVLKIGFAALGAVSAPFLVVAGLIVAAIVAIYTAVTNWDEISKFAKETWAKFTDFLEESLGGIGGRILNALASFPGQIMSFFANIGTGLMNWASSVVGNIVNKFRNMLAEITGIQSLAANTASSMPAASPRTSTPGAPSSPGRRTGGASAGGNTYVDLRNSTFRDDLDLTDRLRRNGQGLTGGFA